MLKVAVIPSHPFHEGLGTDFRTLNQIFRLVELGVELHFISPFRKYASSTKSELFYFHSLNNYPEFYELVYRLTRRAFNNRLWARQTLRSPQYLNWSAANYAKSLERVLTNLDIDVMLAIHHVAAAACARIKGKLGLPLVTDVHGIWAEEIVASGTLERDSRQARIVRDFESEVLRQSDYLITTSEELKIYFVEHYGINHNNVKPVIPCMEPRVSAAVRVSKPSRIVFAGTATYRERIDLLLASMTFVLREYPSAELYMTEKGDSIKAAKELARKLKVFPRYFYFSSRDHFYDFLKDCHIAVITSSDELTRRAAYPSKIYDYMSVGLPIVANDVGAWTRYIRESGCGILTDSTSQSLAKGLLELLQNPQLIHELGQNGLNYLRSILRPDKLLKDIYDVLVKASTSS